jgi:hypothetical protein
MNSLNWQRYIQFFSLRISYVTYSCGGVGWVGSRDANDVHRDVSRTLIIGVTFIRLHMLS